MRSKDVVKVPVVLQMEELEGGAACLGMVLGYYKKWVGLDQLRVACGISRDGIQPESIERAAKEYGMDCKSESLTFEELRKKSDLPAIVTWNESQYIVFRGVSNKEAYVNHPSKGQLHMSEDEFRRSYSGTCLFLLPGKDFKPGGRKPGTLDHLRSILSAHKSMVALVMIASVLATFAAILSPVFTRIFTDYVLSVSDSSWYPYVLYAFAAVIAFNLIAAIVSQILIIRSKGKVAATSSAFYDTCSTCP